MGHFARRTYGLIGSRGEDLVTVGEFAEMGAIGIIEDVKDLLHFVGDGEVRDRMAMALRPEEVAAGR